MRQCERPCGRDVVARSIMIEIREGRGCDGPWGPHAKLKLDHLGKKFWNLVYRVFLSYLVPLLVDPIKEPIPVIPTCHYMMGGIPTKVTGQAIRYNEKVKMKSFLACLQSAKLPVYQYTELTD